MANAHKLITHYASCLGWPNITNSLSLLHITLYHVKLVGIVCAHQLRSQCPLEIVEDEIEM